MDSAAPTDDDIKNGLVSDQYLTSYDVADIVERSSQAFSKAMAARFGIVLTAHSATRTATSSLDFKADGPTIAKLQQLLATTPGLKCGAYQDNIILAFPSFSQPLVVASAGMNLADNLAQGLPLEAAVEKAMETVARNQSKAFFNPNPQAGLKPVTQGKSDITPRGDVPAISRTRDTFVPSQVAPAPAPGESRERSNVITLERPLIGINLDFLKPPEGAAGVAADAPAGNDPYADTKKSLGDLELRLWNDLKHGDLKQRLDDFMGNTSYAQAFIGAHKGAFYSAFDDFYTLLQKLVCGTRVTEEELTVLCALGVAIEQRTAIEKTAIRGQQLPGPEEEKRYLDLDAKATSLQTALIPVTQLVQELKTAMESEKVTSFSFLDFRRAPEKLPLVEKVNADMDALRSQRAVIPNPDNVGSRYMMDVAPLRKEQAKALEAKIDTLKKAAGTKLKTFFSSPEWEQLQKLEKSPYLNEFSLQFVLKNLIGNIEKMRNAGLSTEYAAAFDAFIKEIPDAQRQARTKSCPPTGDSCRTIISDLNKNSRGISDLADDAKKLVEYEKHTQALRELPDTVFYPAKSPIEWQGKIANTARTRGEG